MNNNFLPKEELIKLMQRRPGVKLALNSNHAVDAAFNDAAFNQYNNSIPAIYTTTYLNTFIEQIVPAMNFEKIVGDKIQAGDFATDLVQFPTLGLTGATHVYGDYSLQGQADATVNFETRAVYKMQTTIKAGDEELAKMGKARLDWLGRKRDSAAYVLAAKRNNIGFVGVAGQATYGLLTDPALRPAIVFASSIAVPASTLWKNKTFGEVQTDVLALYSDIVAAGGGNVVITDDQKMFLVMAPQAVTYLEKANDFGLTIRGWLKVTFPQLEVLTAPEYAIYDTNGNYIGSKVQMILKEVAGQPTVTALVTYEYMSHGAVRMQSSIQEKTSSGTAGAGIFQPIGISTGSAA